MKRIIVPTDFSENASDALAYAIDFAGNANTKITMIHVVDSNVSSTEMPLVNTEMLKVKMDAATENMQSLVDFSKKFVANNDKKNLKIESQIVVGSVSNLIKSTAKELSADVIVMGTRGESHSLLEKMFGTASTSVIDDAPCPVILVPKDYYFKPIDNVIFATNLNHGDPFDLWRAGEILKPHTVVIRCVYVAKDQASKDDSFVEKFAKYMIEHSPSIQTIFHTEVSKNVEDVLADYSENYDAEMLIMHRSKKSIWEKIFTHRHTNNMSRKLKSPILVLND